MAVGTFAFARCGEWRTVATGDVAGIRTTLVREISR